MVERRLKKIGFYISDYRYVHAARDIAVIRGICSKIEIHGLSPEIVLLKKKKVLENRKYRSDSFPDIVPWLLLVAEDLGTVEPQSLFEEIYQCAF
jgi:hypothetical protein